MRLNVVNKELYVGAVKINGISGSSVFLVGDTEVIHCSSVYETSPEPLKNHQSNPKDDQEHPSTDERKAT